ncbi:NAD(P)/FAD-dependent oxidoreductase [Halobacillus halophilus]|uniref:NAD(P)/FAD-dependent oxidoreductase n=1 Tax=Halobacillus halophilus TaxID=1570 RepID=UPI001CD798DB|nr:NAD(FAD)-utilizing dehydrogenase [Halobacillus halophilus]MCA1009554.1 NAD(FAD)-utilizing dehydrogenase [Halobacillus halophilus]
MEDIIIIGAGVSSIFFAHKLVQENKNLSIRIIDKGKPLKERICGLDEGLSCTCSEGCNRYIGYAGLGKSEGKFNYTNDFGGDLGRKIGGGETLELMKEVDRILQKHGAESVGLYSTKNKSLAAKAEKHGLEVLSAEVRHLGTKVAIEVFQKLYETLQEHIHFTFETNVTSLQPEAQSFFIETDKGNFHSKQLIIGTGKSGGNWINKQMDDLGLNTGETRLDLGLRIEMREDQLNAILKDTFETKLRCRGKGYEATTYCMNPRGRIIRKYQNGLVMPDGQNKNEEKTESGNLNFTLFVPRYFPSYDQAMQTAHRIIGGINQGDGRIINQRLGDFYANRPSTELSSNLIRPSLEAEAGNLAVEIPDLYLRSVLEFMGKLENLIECPIHPDTLLYGMDAKFYEPQIYTTENFETQIKDLYLIGDCSGITHSLSQAAASGLYVADKILQKHKGLC